MALANYTDLKTSIADWLNRADLDGKIPDFIALAESTLNDILRSADMVTSATVAISYVRADIPDELKKVTGVMSCLEVFLNIVLPLSPKVLNRRPTDKATTR
mgnify:CR=1 FL=1